MDLAIIQTFLNRPVRFFKANFEVDLHPHDGDTASPKFPLETWAIPMPDYAEAVGYPTKRVWRMIQLNLPSFQDFFKYELIFDRANAQRRNTILMAVEMCETLTMRLQASRIKDPEIRARVIRFQRWVPIVFHMIRTRRLRPIQWNKGIDLDSSYLPLLSVPSGKSHKERVVELANAEGKSPMTIYRRLKAVRGTNIITRRGVPRKTRARKAA